MDYNYDWLLDLIRSTLKIYAKTSDDVEHKETKSLNEKVTESFSLRRKKITVTNIIINPVTR